MEALDALIELLTATGVAIGFICGMFVLGGLVSVGVDILLGYE